MIPALLLLLAAFSSSGYALSPQMSTPVLLCSNCQQPSLCHAQCPSSGQILYQAETGPICPLGGAAWQIWSMNYDGTNQVNLSATAAGLSQFTLNAGSPEWSPDGNWVAIQFLDPRTNQACDTSVSNPGAGLSQDLAVCTATFSTCWQLYILAAPNLGEGILRPMWNADTSILFIMYIQGIGHIKPGIYGEFGQWPFSNVAGVPTLGTVVNFTNGNTYDWYEPAGYNPKDRCIVYFTSTGTGNNTNWANYVYAFNTCTQSIVSQLQSQATYNEFWDVDPTGSLAVSISTEFSPGNPPGSTAPVQGEITISGANSTGGWRPLTGYNIPGSSDFLNAYTTTGYPVWGLKSGAPIVVWELETGHCPGCGNANVVYSIWESSFLPATGIVSGQSVTTGPVKIK